MGSNKWRAPFQGLSDNLVGCGMEKTLSFGPTTCCHVAGPVLKVGSAGSLEFPEESSGFPQGQESACEATFDVVSIYHTML